MTDINESAQTAPTDERSSEKITFKNFVLDPFQVEAVKSIEKNNSVVVSAATGTGKTLIADYAIHKFKNLSKRVIYTAPIKALSNQKYRDFKEEYGADHVGIMTGDVVINPTAHLIIMTTEIYRNMLVTKDPMIETISYVIFDEIHFMSDAERGTIWEESIIFSPSSIRFLCLSATIPNAQDFADWISSIKKHDVDVVSYTKRAVPLTHSLYDIEYKLISMEEAAKLSRKDKMPDYYKIMRRKRSRKQSKEKPKTPKHTELVKQLKHDGLLPAIFFVFSRKGCEDKASELSIKEDFLSKEQKHEVISTFNRIVKKEYWGLGSVSLLRRVLEKGIGVHHAGLLPQLKEVVEDLFARGLVKVLYATETFAVGINMPAKAVCFNSLVKYDGTGFHMLRSKEYFQMAGRAGRRGIDTEGHAIALLERRSELDKIIKLTSSDSEPIISQFRLEPNTVLNMMHNHTEEERDVILKSNFDYFLRKREEEGIRIKARFKNLVKRLTVHGYIAQDGTLTEKGLFATHIYSYELLVSEIFATSVCEDLTEEEICIILAVIVYEHKRSDEFFIRKGRKDIERLLKKVAVNDIISKGLDFREMRNLWPVVSAWRDGCSFEDLMEMSNFQEGDYIRLFRQMVDLMHQIRKAHISPGLDQKIVNCMNALYRDVVKFEFG
ncbi:MAG: DEAD/DEAH box helicase [Candidatus Woesearchaeota archaeon]